MMLMTVAWLIVISTLSIGFGMMSSLGRSVEGRAIWPGLFVIIVGATAGALAYLGSPTPLQATDIPMAFIEVAALVLGP